MEKSHARNINITDVLLISGIIILYLHYRNNSLPKENDANKYRDAEGIDSSADNRFSFLTNRITFDEAKSELDWIWEQLKRSLQNKFPERTIHPLNKISTFYTPGGTSGSYAAFARLINDTPSLFNYMGKRNIDSKDIEDCDNIGSLCFPIKDRKG